MSGSVSTGPDQLLRAVEQGWLAEGEDDREQRWGEENSPERNDDAEHDRAEEGGPPGDLGRAVQYVRADDETFEDNDQAVESEYEAEAPFVVSAEGYREDRADEGDHAAEGGDDLEQAAEDCPEWSPRNTDQFQAYEPENADDQRIEGGRSPPVEQRIAGGLEMGARIVVSKVHTNLTALCRIRPAGTEL